MNSRFIDELIDRADIVDIIGRYVKLQKSGANFFGLCPFHPDSTPSMSVSPKKKIFKCFSCGASGNVITFIQKFKKVSGSEAIKEVAKLSGYSDQDINKFFQNKDKNFNSNYWKLVQLNNDANDIFKTLLHNDENKKYLDYLTNRKISKQSILKFEIGFSGKGQEKQIIYDLLTNKEINKSASWNEDDLVKASLINVDERTLEISDYFRNRITFPIKNQQGDIIAFIARDITPNTKLKYLTSRETSIFNKTKTLYNFHRVALEKPQTLIVIEGNIDLISLYESSLDESKYGCIALMGTALTNDHLNMISNLKCINNVILWFDNDNAGKQSTIVNGIKFLKKGFKTFVVNNTSSYKDINEILVKTSKEDVLKYLNSANDLDFISFYIKYKLTNIDKINLENNVKEIFALIRKYGDALWWTKYATLISQLTNLSIDDINNSYKNFVTKEFSVSTNYSFEQEKTKVHNQFYKNPVVKNLLKSFNDLLSLVLLNPLLAESIYDEMKYKKSNIDEINDVICIIKNLVADSKVNLSKLAKDLFDKKQIQMKTYKFILDFLEEQKKQFEEIGIRLPISKSRCLSLVRYINIYFDEIIVEQLRQQLLEQNLSEKDKTDIKNKLNHLTEKINEFKKNKNCNKYKV